MEPDNEHCQVPGPFALRSVVLSVRKKKFWLLLYFLFLSLSALCRRDPSCATVFYAVRISMIPESLLLE